jgi:hypothetical protein
MGVGEMLLLLLLLLVLLLLLMCSLAGETACCFCSV